jgi:hypothetical protein
MLRNTVNIERLPDGEFPQIQEEALEYAHENMTVAMVGRDECGLAGNRMKKPRETDRF